MTPSPAAGSTAIDLRDALIVALENLQGLAAMTTSGPALQAQYLSWASRTAASLRTKMDSAERDLLLAPQTSLGIAGITPEPWNRDVLLQVLGAEVQTRADVLRAALDQIEQQIDHWAQQPGRLIVPDTSLFIEHPAKLEEMVLADDLDEREVPLRIVIPIVVVDELDGLKQSRDRDVRWRASYSLAVLDRLLTDGIGPARLRDADRRGIGEGRIPRGEVWIEILLDPPNHVRLPINDDEIVERAIAVHRFAGRPVTVITYDTGQSTRARAAGLTVHKLAKPRDDEPPPGAHTNR